MKVLSTQLRFCCKLKAPKKLQFAIIWGCPVIDEIASSRKKVQKRSLSA
jgi:hypothetical protein